jgi:hypothetical protein
MATKAQIDRLAQRIEALAPSTRLDGSAAMIIVDREGEDAARERHCQEHPGDRTASRVIFMHIVDPKPAMGRPRSSNWWK